MEQSDTTNTNTKKLDEGETALEEAATVPKSGTKRARTSTVIQEMKCSECEFVTNKRLLLRKHCILKHADKVDPIFLLNNYKCDFCEKVFKDPIQLSNHKNVHLGLKPYKCVECDFNFTTRGELIRHTRYKHTLERPHKCTMCDYSSVELSKLKRHMRVHTDERPYLCPYCDYASRDTFKLKRHIRVHTGEKPYECPLCKKCFSQSNSLKVHMKSSHSDGSRIQKKNARKQTKSDDKEKVKLQEVSIAQSGTDPLDNQSQNIFTSPVDSSTQKKAKLTYFSSVDDAYYSNEKYIQCVNESINLNANNAQSQANTSNIAHGNFVQNDVIDENLNVFTCTECSMKFTSAKLLEEHFVKHSGDRPFQCEICNMKFGAKFALRSHILSHDAEYTEKLKTKLKTINESTMAHSQSMTQETIDQAYCELIELEKNNLNSDIADTETVTLQLPVNITPANKNESSSPEKNIESIVKNLKSRMQQASS